MKFRSILFSALAVSALSMTSCDKDDTVNDVSGTGSLGVEFDNAFGDNDLILGVANAANSQNEVLKVSTVKYIISNIVLTKADGTTFTYPKSQSYFIVNEADTNTHVLELSNVPAGDYTKIKFGVGVDKAQFDLGAEGQGDFLALAQSEAMLWSWSAGYKFVAFEGTFTSPTVTTDTSYMVHTGQTGTDYNYTEVTLNLPTSAKVRKTIAPDIHIITDVAKFVDGTNKINLTAANSMGMGAMIMGGSQLPLITANVKESFRVDHVHND